MPLFPPLCLLILRFTFKNLEKAVPKRDLSVAHFVIDVRKSSAAQYFSEY